MLVFCSSNNPSFALYWYCFCSTLKEQRMLRPFFSPKMTVKAQAYLSIMPLSKINNWKYKKEAESLCSTNVGLYLHLLPSHKLLLLQFLLRNLQRDRKQTLVNVHSPRAVTNKFLHTTLFNAQWLLRKQRILFIINPKVS